MAKLKDDPITAKDMADFVSSDSDFAFEMQVLAELTSLGFACSHSGTYRDPVTEKIRQFDIRATKVAGGFQISIAVECKNLKSSFPLLISGVPRINAEAFHEQITIDWQQSLAAVSTRRVASVYKAGEIVGKKSDQVGKDASSGALISNDETTFDKLNQAVNSCQDLVSESVRVENPHGSVTKRVVIPMLEIPSSTLWQVDYAADGGLLVAPRPVSRSTLFLNHSWQALSTYSGYVFYRLSHLELVTFGSLSEAVDSYFAKDGMFAE